MGDLNAEVEQKQTPMKEVVVCHGLGSQSGRDL